MTNAELIKAGDRYGRLTVVSLVKEGVYKCGKKYRKWLCVCDCGKTNEVTESNLRCGSVRSCSCLRDELLRDRHLTHGCSMRFRSMVHGAPTVDAVPVKWIENYIDSLRAIGLIFNAVIIDGLLRDYKKRADGERRSDEQ